MIYHEFYSELGKLLYAVADIDNVITQQEKKALQHIVTHELLPAESHTDSFGTNAAFYSEIEFDFMDESIGDAETAFESFKSYVDEHHTAFDEKLKKTCLHVIEELAAAYYGTNKREKELIDELKKTLNKINPKKRRKNRALIKR